MALNQAARERLETLARERKLKTNYHSNSPWENAAKTIVNDDAMVIRVNTEDDLVAIIKELEILINDTKEQITTRAVAGHFDELGLFKESCCWGLGGFINRSNPVSKAALKSYSYAPKTGADVILEFSEKFYKQSARVITHQKDTAEEYSTVIIPAGMTFTQLLKKLAHNGLTLPQTPSICDRSVIGSIVNGIDGLEQHVKHIWYINHRGELQDMSDTDPDFHDKLVKFRLLGVITKIEMATVPNIKVKQQVGWAYDVSNFSDGFKLGDKETTLAEAFKRHENIRINMTPTYRQTPDDHATGIPITNIEIIAEDKTTDRRTKNKEDTLIDEVFEYFGQKAAKYGTEKMYDLFYQKDLEHLVRAFQMLAAALHRAQRSDETLVKYKSELAGSHVKHALDILKSCVYVPVANDSLAENIEAILDFANSLLVTNYDKGQDGPQTPINFITVRVLDGSNHGLSNTKTKEGEKLIAIEFNGNRHAQGYDEFLSEFSAKLSESGYSAHFDLSKLMPSGSVYFSGGKEGAQKMKQYISEAYGSDGIGTSPFVPPLYQSLLDDVASAEALEDITQVMPALQVQPKQQHSYDEMIAFLEKTLEMALQLTKHFVKDHHPDVTAALAYFEGIAKQAIKVYEQQKRQAEILPAAEPVAVI